MKKISIIIPMKNEEQSIPELWARLVVALGKIDWQWEVIFIDDGSTDRTLEVLNVLREKDSRARVLSFVRNFGKASALQAGFDNAKGDYVLTMDADLQHEPEEIPNFVTKLKEGNDMVISWRHKRRDNALTRKIPSWLANRIIEKMSGLKLHDFGGTFHAYRKELLEGIELYSELHRFIPALANWNGGYKYVELPINNPDRKYGKSNYGLGRIYKVIVDLIVVKYFASYVNRPLQIFGSVGFSLLVLGVLGNIFLLYKKVFLGTLVLVEHGPLFMVSIFLVIIALQFIFFGIMAEMLSRIYFRSSDRHIYKLRTEME